MRGRELLGRGVGAAAAWPLALGPYGAWAQRRERVRRIGVLTNIASDDAELQSRNAAFVQGVQKLDWEVGRDVQIDCRWTLGSAERMRDYAAELVALAPDVLLAVGAEVVETLQRATRAVPIVFVLRACSGRSRGR